MSYDLKIKFDREEDGRWIAEIPELPGVMAYGENRDEAAQHVRALALRVIADQVESQAVSASQELLVSVAAR